MRPLVVVEGSGAMVADVLSDLRSDGWTVVPGWWTAEAGDYVVCSGVVATAEDAASALLAAVGGAGLVVDARASRDVIDRLCEDLRHLGTLDHRTASTARAPRLTIEERQLAGHLLEGLTLGEAARTLSISRRTADRRMASIRDKLGVVTTAEALVRLGSSASGARASR